MLPRPIAKRSAPDSFALWIPPAFLLGNSSFPSLIFEGFMVDQRGIERKNVRKEVQDELSLE
jgi:hypothetical protein